MLLKRDELRRNKNQQNYIREKLAHYLRINRRFCYIKNYVKLCISVTKFVHYLFSQKYF